MNTVPLKTITYRGGLVRFRIPADWHEEYEEAGGGTFYSPRDESGTLRLNVLTLQAPPKHVVTYATAMEVLAGDAVKYGGSPVPLREGVGLLCYDLPGEDRGEPLVIRYWHMVQAVPPKNVRVILFSHTLLSEQFANPDFAAELALLDEQIRRAEFAPVLGILP